MMHQPATLPCEARMQRAGEPTPGAWRGVRAAVGTLLCVGVLVAVEAALVAPGHALAADIADATMVLLLLNIAAIALRRSSSSDARNAAHALQALALVGLARVVGFGLPLRVGSLAVGTIVISILIGLAAAQAAPGFGLPLSAFVRNRMPRVQMCAAGSGLVLGFLAYVSGAPRLWTPGAGAGRIAVTLVAVGAVSVAGELLFRGVVQGTLQRSAGRLGLLGAVALFTATYLSLAPTVLVMSIALAGLVFSYAVARTGSLMGAAAGHALFLWTGGGVWPVLLGHTNWALSHGVGATIAISLALAAMTVIVLRAGPRYWVVPRSPQVTSDVPSGLASAAVAVSDRH
jgi:membrane protease YdiL (CAAX protease family)